MALIRRILTSAIFRFLHIKFCYISIMTWNVVYKMKTWTVVFSRIERRMLSFFSSSRTVTLTKFGFLFLGLTGTSSFISVYRDEQLLSFLRLKCVYNIIAHADCTYELAKYEIMPSGTRTSNNGSFYQMYIWCAAHICYKNNAHERSEYTYWIKMNFWTKSCALSFRLEFFICLHGLWSTTTSSLIFILPSLWILFNLLLFLVPFRNTYMI